HEFEKGAPVRDVLAAARAPPPELSAELAALDARIADPTLYESAESNAVLARYGEVQREMAAAMRGDGEDAGPLAEELGFAAEDMDRDVATLSGGQRTRLFLARTLSAATGDGLLVLDEPTNHLD